MLPTIDQKNHHAKSLNSLHRLDDKTTSAKLILSNDYQGKGKLIGKPLIAKGELVFTTGLVGYVESITDPSYFGQILTFAYPLIGNYGVIKFSSNDHPSNTFSQTPNDHIQQCSSPPLGYESDKIFASAVLVVVESEYAYHYSSFLNLSKWLYANDVPGIALLDTRHLITMIRDCSPLFGRVEPENAQQTRKINGFDLGDGEFFDPKDHSILSYVTTSHYKLYKICDDNIGDNSSNPKINPFNYSDKTYELTENDPSIDLFKMNYHTSKSLRGCTTPRLVLIDCGVKNNLIRKMLEYGCEVLQVNYQSDFSLLDCSGWLISNGPGDPSHASSVIAQIKKLLQQTRPILGVCLGHQLVGMACGILCEKMTYGHRSHNQPVYVPGTRRCFMSSQNHGFHLVESNHWPCEWKVWFRNANDSSIEGIRHIEKPFYTVQFHPEACSGPKDTQWILKQFSHKLRSVNAIN